VHAARMGVRVSNDVLVVPPFDCAWLSSPDVEHLTTASAEGGEGIVVSFDAKADSDVTVILKGRPDVAKRDVDDRPARRLDHWSGRQDEGRHDSTSTYVIILGSHRNSRLCIEKNGVVVELAKGPGVPTLPTRGRDAFTRCFVSWHPSRGALVVGAGEHARHAWVDPAPHTEAICEVGLSTWDDYAQYRDIEIRAIDPNGGSVGNSWSATPMDSPRGGRWTTSPVGVGGKLTTSDDSSKVSTSAPSSLLALCIDTLARNLPAAAAHDPRGMRAMPPEHVAALLTHDALGDCVGSEDELWTRVSAWCVGRRGDEVREVLPHVRFPQLETETLDGVEEWATEIHMDPDAFEMLRELVAEARLRRLPEEYRDEDFASPPGSPLAARRMQVSPHGFSVRIAAAAAEGTSRRDRRLRARLNELASIRSKPRRGHGSVLSFICAGDSNGLFRYLGRTGAKGEGGRVTDFMNPARLGVVEVTASSPASRGGTSPHDVCAEVSLFLFLNGPFD